MEIPFRRLSEDALRAVIEEFVTRDGTDYGAAEVSLEARVAQVRAQLERGEALLHFDPDSSSCSIHRRDAPPRQP